MTEEDADILGFDWALVARPIKMVILLTALWIDVKGALAATDGCVLSVCM
jgi:hypothetical protein